MTALLSLIPIPWRVAGIAIIGIAFSATFGLGFWKGHSSGYESAENKYRAQIAELQADYNKRAAEAAARFQAELAEKTTQAMAASDKYYQEVQAHEQTRANIQDRIVYVTRNSTHFFSAEFVRVFNDAVGAVTPGGGATKDANSGSPDKGAGASKAADPWVQGKVTEADILRWIAYYGKRTRDIEAQLRGLIQIVKD